MVETARNSGVSFNSEIGAFVAGYVTHAILDRHAHPFINYFSGWVDPEDEQTVRYRSMHPFFERIIDVHVLSRFRGMDVNEYNFFGRVLCGEAPPVQIIETEIDALKHVSRRARNDENLSERLTNAYVDAMGYYRYSNLVTPARLHEGLRREKDGEIGRRWLAILHPFALPATADYLNDRHAPWTDPCDRNLVYAASFWDLFASAFEECTAVLKSVADAWNAELPLYGSSESLESVIGNSGLSDNTDRPAPGRKRHSSPLPLPELLTYLRQRIADNDIPDVPIMP
jgi:hypothetical protein